MEAIENSSKESYVDAINFSLPSTGKYITNRSSVTYQTIGGNVFNPNQGSKIVRFKLSDENLFLDPNSFRVMLTLVNTSTDATKTKLRPVGGPWGFFKRMIIKCRGQMIEDISDYNRVHEMASLLSPPEARRQELAESIGFNGDPTDNFMPDNAINTLSISQGESMSMVFKPVAGIFNQPKYIPLRYCPIEIDLEISGQNDPVIYADNQSDPTNATELFRNSTQSWELVNLQCKTDVITIDNDLDNMFASDLLSGKHLNFYFNTYVSQIQTVVNRATQINVTRSLSKLDSIFVSMIRNIDMSIADTNDQGITRSVWWRKDWNDFFSPMWFSNTNNDDEKSIVHNSADELEKFQIQIGSKLYPEYPIQSHNEAYYQLRKTLGMRPTCLTGKTYRNNRMIMGISTQKMSELAFSGSNTQNSFVTVHLQVPEDGRPDRMHVVLNAQYVMRVSDSSVDVFE